MQFARFKYLEKNLDLFNVFRIKSKTQEMEDNETNRIKFIYLKYSSLLFTAHTDK